MYLTGQVILFNLLSLDAFGFPRANVSQAAESVLTKQPDNSYPRPKRSSSDVLPVVGLFSQR